MHEMSIVDGVLKTVDESARAAGATRVLSVKLRIGDMTEVVREALDFAWEVMTDDDPLAKGCELEVEEIHPRSVCVQCGYEFDHDRFHCRCPKCGSGQTLTTRGRELEIASIDIETPDD